MKKLKRITVIILAMVLLLNTFATVSANTNDIKVLLDGQQIIFDVQPQIINGRTMVPMRKIFEALGATVSWDGASRTATGKLGDTVVNVTIDSNVLFKNGVPKTLDVAPALIDGRTLVPARAIAESFDCVVDWIGETRTVTIARSESFTQEKTSLTASEISDRVAPSVFYIEVYDEKSNCMGSGSGFFISSDGAAVTNYHVIEDTAYALIRTIDGDIFGVTNIIAYDAGLDVAIIKVDKMSMKEGKYIDGFPCVTMADSDKIKAGQTVYAIGSPDGLENTISDGIISNANRKIGENTFIQTTAAIYHGSSGGALIDEYGEVLGITSRGIPEAENVGFAIPINIIKMFDVNAEGISYAEFATGNNAFTLEIYPEVIELEVGQYGEILVYAEGKGDWSIYWETEYDYLINCEWGEWSKEYDGIIPLTITGIREGVATVTVYSDVDFKGKDITVYIKKPAVETYHGTDVPTYTAITGVRLADYDQLTYNDCYIYYFYETETPQRYLDYLDYNGFVFDKKKSYDYGTAFYYISPKGEYFSFVAAFEYNQIWIMVDRY